MPGARHGERPRSAPGDAIPRPFAVGFAQRPVERAATLVALTAFVAVLRADVRVALAAFLVVAVRVRAVVAVRLAAERVLLVAFFAAGLALAASVRTSRTTSAASSLVSRRPAVRVALAAVRVSSPARRAVV